MHDAGPVVPGGEAAPRPADFVVRAARASDAASFLELWRGVVAEGRYVRTEHIAHGVRFYRRRFRSAPNRNEANLVAVARDEVIGHVHVQREEHPVTRHVATLGIAVRADWRGRGAGSALLSGAISWARDVGIDKLVLSVYPDNAAAQALYRKFGFVQEGRLSRQSRKSYGYEDEILMARWIGSEEP